MELWSIAPFPVISLPLLLPECAFWPSMWHWLRPCSDWLIFGHLPLCNAPGVTLEHTRLYPHRFNCGIRSWRQDFLERGCPLLCVFPALSLMELWSHSSLGMGVMQQRHASSSLLCMLSTRYSLCRATTCLKPWFMFKKCFGQYFFCTVLRSCRKTLKFCSFCWLFCLSAVSYIKWE